MITSKDEYSIRSNYPVPASPLELLIAKEESAAAASKSGFDVELILFMADFAARYPEKWRTIKERINNGRASINDLALLLKINRRTVLRHFEDLRTEARKWNLEGRGPWEVYRVPERNKEQ